MIELVECFCESKTPNPGECEDRYYIGDHFVVVADGTTSALPPSLNNHTTGSPGQLAADAVIRSVSELPPDIEPLAAVQAIASAIREIPNYRANGASATAIIYSQFKREIWSIGDCQYLVDGKAHTNTMSVDLALSEVRSLVLEYEILEGRSIQDLQRYDPGREFILPAIQRQSLLENTKSTMFGYTVLNGDKLQLSDIEVVPISLKTKELVLASDGYPFLYPTLKDSEEELKSLIKQDPLLFRKYKSTKGVTLGNKSFDDRTFIRFNI